MHLRHMFTYNECLNHTDKEQFAKNKANECLDKLRTWDKMSQREFQTVMGQLEAYGEVYIREVKPGSLKLD